jgi:predicted PurR-regulated permease PerM
MSETSAGAGKDDLGYAAAVIALAIAMVAAAIFLYYLIDVLLILFLGIVVAAALQPGHVWLARWGVPKGLAVLLIYLLFIVSITAVALLIGPALLEQINAFAADIPDQYTKFVKQLQASPTLMWRRLGVTFPPFSTLTKNLAASAPDLFDDFVAFMTSTASFLTYFVIVLAIGFYWTMDVPRLERVVLSLLPVARRPQVLEIWREIEFKLGAFVRGQGLAMLLIGIASGIGYYLIGLPNVLVLAVLAGLLEAVPFIGPIIVAALAALLAVPQGLTAVFLVLGFSTLLQQFENVVLVPRIMNHTVGISALAGLFAILAFGTLYGVLGVFVAIPLAVVVQVLLDHLVINPEPAPEAPALVPDSLSALHAQVQTLQQRIRTRLRERDTRLVSSPQTLEHVADSVDQRIEQVAEHVETLIAAAQGEIGSLKPEIREAFVEELQQATDQLEKAVEQVEAVIPLPESDGQSTGPPLEPAVLEEVQKITQQAEETVQQVAGVMAEAHAGGNSSPEKVETPCENIHDHPPKAA